MIWQLLLKADPEVELEAVKVVFVIGNIIFSIECPGMIGIIRVFYSKYYLDTVVDSYPQP